jgi:hypothetical protein
VPGLAALGVLHRGQAEQDHGRHTFLRQLVHLLAQRVAGVLHHARQRADDLGLVDVLAHEQRDDEVVDRQPGLGDQPAQGRRAAEPAKPALRKAHRRALRAARNDLSAHGAE